MPSTATTTTSPTTSKTVLSAINNIPRRVRSSTLRSQPRPSGKENAPPDCAPQDQPRSSAPKPSKPRRRPAPLLPTFSTQVPVFCTSPVSPSPVGAFGELVLPVPPLGSTPAVDRWAPQDGQIIIKIWVPTTDEIWKLRVPEDVGLAAFRARVAAKLGFEVSFSAVSAGNLRTIGDEDAFREWVAGRVQNGRNTLLTAHRLVLQ